MCDRLGQGRGFGNPNPNPNAPKHKLEYNTKRIIKLNLNLSNHNHLVIFDSPDVTNRTMKMQLHLKLFNFSAFYSLLQFQIKIVLQQLSISGTHYVFLVIF